MSTSKDLSCTHLLQCIWALFSTSWICLQNMHTLINYHNNMPKLLASSIPIKTCTVCNLIHFLWWHFSISHRVIAHHLRTHNVTVTMDMPAWTRGIANYDKYIIKSLKQNITRQGNIILHPCIWHLCNTWSWQLVIFCLTGCNIIAHIILSTNN